MKKENVLRRRTWKKLFLQKEHQQVKAKPQPKLIQKLKRKLLKKKKFRKRSKQKESCLNLKIM